MQMNPQDPAHQTTVDGFPLSADEHDMNQVLLHDLELQRQQQQLMPTFGMQPPLQSPFYFPPPPHQPHDWMQTFTPAGAFTAPPPPPADEAGELTFTEDLNLAEEGWGDYVPGDDLLEEQ